MARQAGRRSGASATHTRGASRRDGYAWGLWAIAVVVGALAAAQGPARAADGATRLAQQETQPALPGGASSLSETYGDWRVRCAVGEERKTCVFAQSRVDSERQQRVLAIELTPSSPDEVAGRLVLPFGLALDDSVTLVIDDETIGEARFETCVPGGCVVPLAFGAGAIQRLRQGERLTVAALRSDDGTEIVFAVSLDGFSAALDRTAALAE